MKEDKLKIILPILQGLLASGKYIALDEDDGTPYVTGVDHGEKFKDIYCYQRVTSHVIDDAIELSQELERAMLYEEELSRGDK